MREKMVLVEWDDAAFNSGLYDKLDKSRYTPVKTKTVGFVLESNKSHIIVSHDRFYQDDGKLYDERHITTIPKKMIRRIIELKGEKLG